MKKKKCTQIGGQAVMEGVMMRGTRSMATAVRNPRGEIIVESSRFSGDKKWYKRIPIVRGFINFFEMMIMGVKILMRSAEVYGDEEPSEFEKKLSKKLHIDLMSIVITIGLVLGLALSIGLFIVLPETIRTLVCKWLDWSETSVWSNLFAGLVRIIIFICYILLTTLMKDVKRVFMYHGAEHKTITCFESDMPLTVENVAKCSCIHDRCGTNFMIIVMIISILFFSLLGLIPGIQDTWLLRVATRIVLLPFVAGVSYEVLKFLAKWDNWLVRILKAPGLAMQKITTMEPTTDMMEVAIMAFTTVQRMDEDESIPTTSFDIDKRYSLARLEIENLLRKVKADNSEADWIFARATGLARSELHNLQFISEAQYKQALDYAQARATGKPLQYVFGDTEFYGITIKVNSNVLIPRFDTELLAEEVIKAVEGQSSVLDLCTGSGAIAIAVAKNTQAVVTGSDISKSALDVARRNAEMNGADVKFIESNMFEGIDGKYDIIVSNPPYIPTNDIKKLDKIVQAEPIAALDGGKDGLDYYRIIANHARTHLNYGGKLMLEIGIGQTESVISLLDGYSNVIVKKDYNGIDRIIIANV